MATALGMSLPETSGRTDLHQQLLEVAARQEAARRARFAAIRTKPELEALQKALRESFLRGLGGLPERRSIPAVHKVGMIEAEDHTVEKLTYESFPGYFVPALLYRPRRSGPVRPGPAVLSPCGHSDVGKAERTYQTLHVNLARRGYVVLTYDPVGQGERSQYWDASRGRSRFNLGCGEHAVLGNPLYLLGGNLARYRVHDGLRGLDYLATLPEVDPSLIGCVGNSGGGTLTAYIAAIDPRVAVAAICCYITTLPRRMGNRIQEDPSSDPEQDLFEFVSGGLDHAGLLALIAPRPTLLGSAKFDFFPIEGTHETFAEAKRLYEVHGAGERLERVEAPEHHGLTLPLRLAVYEWFDRWLVGRRTEPGQARELPVKLRPARELRTCPDGQANLSLGSRPLLPLALEEFGRRPRSPAVPLRELLRPDPGMAGAAVTEVSFGTGQGRTLILAVNGNETRDWKESQDFLQALVKKGHAVAVVDPRGVGPRRTRVTTKAPGDFADPLSGVEENVAYNALLVGKNLPGIRVADLLTAVRELKDKLRPRSVVVCGRRDAALTACLAATIEPGIDRVAAEGLLLSFRSLFEPHGRPINASWIVPGLLRDFGDIDEILARIAPRKILVAAGIGELRTPPPSTRVVKGTFSNDPGVLVDWLSV